MSESAEYERRAADVQALAQKTPPGPERDAMLRIARQWRELAEDVRRRQKRGL